MIPAIDGCLCKTGLIKVSCTAVCIVFYPKHTCLWQKLKQGSMYDVITMGQWPMDILKGAINIFRWAIKYVRTNDMDIEVVQPNGWFKKKLRQKCDSMDLFTLWDIL